MKKLIASSLAVAAIGFAGLANAETWSPAGPFTLKNIGDFTLVKGLTLKCNVNASGSLGGDTATIDEMLFSGGPAGICQIVVLEGLPYNLEAIDATTVSLEGVVVTAVTGDCAGDMLGEFDQATGRIFFDEQEIPSTTGDGPCKVSGTVETIPAASYTFP